MRREKHGRSKHQPFPPSFSLAGAVSQTFSAGDGLTAGIALDSVAGLTLGADAAVAAGPRGAIRAVGARYNSKAGPTVTVKAQPAPWAKAAATLHPRTRTAVASAALSPAWLATGPGSTATLTLDVAAPYGEARGGGKKAAPKMVAGMKWGF